MHPDDDDDDNDDDDDDDLKLLKLETLTICMGDMFIIILTRYQLLFTQSVVHKRTGQTVQCLVVTVATEKPVTMSTAHVSMDAMKDLREISVKQVSMYKIYSSAELGIYFFLIWK